MSSISLLSGTSEALNHQLHILLPEISLAAGMLGVLLLDLIGGKRVGFLLLTGFAIGALVVYGYFSGFGPLVSVEDNRNLLFDYPFGKFFRLALGAATVICLMSHAFEYSPSESKKLGSETLLYWLGLALGLSLWLGSVHMLSFFLSFELVSMCSYLLVASRLKDAASAEAGLKYVLYGSLASALLLVGMGLLYALTGEMSLTGLFESQFVLKLPPESLLFAWVFFFAGVSFKIAALPFHFWAPDIYQGSSISVATGLSILPKIVGILLLFIWSSVFLSRNLQLPAYWIPGFLAAATLFFANLSAWRQSNFRRLLAYSSIAHTGFMMLALLAPDPQGEAFPLKYYLLVYAVMQFGAFALADCLERITGTQNMSAYAGLGRKYPMLAIAATVLMASLAGLPPFWGFLAKLYIFLPLWNAFQQTQDVFLVLLLGFAVLNTVLGLFYYLKLPYLLWVKTIEPETNLAEPMPRNRVSEVVLYLSATTVLLGMTFANLKF